MVWQEIVFTIGGWIFILALVPSLISKDKPALLTSLTTGTVLLSFAYGYFSLSLTTSGVSMGLLSIAWYILAFQKYIQMRKQKINI